MKKLLNRYKYRALIILILNFLIATSGSIWLTYHEVNNKTYWENFLEGFVVVPFTLFILGVGIGTIVLTFWCLIQLYQLWQYEAQKYEKSKQMAEESQKETN